MHIDDINPHMRDSPLNLPQLQMFLKLTPRHLMLFLLPSRLALPHYTGNFLKTCSPKSAPPLPLIRSIAPLHLTLLVDHWGFVMPLLMYIHLHPCPLDHLLPLILLYLHILHQALLIRFFLLLIHAVGAVNLP